MSLILYSLILFGNVNFLFYLILIFRLWCLLIAFTLHGALHDCAVCNMNVNTKAVFFMLYIFQKELSCVALQDMEWSALTYNMVGPVFTWCSFQALGTYITEYMMQSSTNMSDSAKSSMAIGLIRCSGVRLQKKYAVYSEPGLKTTALPHTEKPQTVHWAEATPGQKIILRRNPHSKV